MSNAMKAVVGKTPPPCIWCECFHYHADLFHGIIQNEAEYLLRRNLRSSKLAKSKVKSSQSHLRKVLYRTYIRAVHGTLGFGVRKKNPFCVVSLIRCLFPSPNGALMGHKSANDDDDSASDKENFAEV